MDYNKYIEKISIRIGIPVSSLRDDINGFVLIDKKNNRYFIFGYANFTNCFGYILTDFKGNFINSDFRIHKFKRANVKKDTHWFMKKINELKIKI